MLSILSAITSALNFFPGIKTRLAAVLAFGLAVIAAWNGAAPELGVDFTILIPDWVNAAVLALLGAGAANQKANGT